MPPSRLTTLSSNRSGPRSDASSTKIPGEGLGRVWHHPGVSTPRRDLRAGSVQSASQRYLFPVPFPAPEWRPEASCSASLKRAEGHQCGAEVRAELCQRDRIRSVSVARRRSSASRKTGTAAAASPARSNREAFRSSTAASDRCVSTRLGDWAGSTLPKRASDFAIDLLNSLVVGGRIRSEPPGSRSRSTRTSVPPEFSWSDRCLYPASGQSAPRPERRPLREDSRSSEERLS